MEDASGDRRGSHFEGLGAAVCDAVGTVDPNEAPCTTPEEEEYPEWWGAGPKAPDNYEFVAVRSFCLLLHLPV